MSTQWLEAGNTSILMEEREVGCLKEWQPVAQITLRQIYPTVDPKWYAWHLEVVNKAEKFDTKQEACAWALSVI